MKHHFFTKLVAVALTASSLSTSVYGANGTGYPTERGTRGDPNVIGPGYPTRDGTLGNPLKHLIAPLMQEMQVMRAKLTAAAANPANALHAANLQGWAGWLLAEEQNLPTMQGEDIIGLRKDVSTLQVTLKPWL